MLDSKFGTFEKDPLWEQIAARLLLLLQEKQLKPGDQLPPERELAAMMQVSRPSLREALRALSMMNVIEIRQGAGTFVTSLEPELLVEQLSLVLSLDDSSFEELFEARKILEVGIIGLAAKRLTDEHLITLKEALIKAEEAVGDSAAFLEADMALHKKITNVAQNAILSRVFDSISKLSLASRRRTITVNEIREEALQDHRKIIAMLETRNPEAAQQAMLQHLDHVEKRLKSIVAVDDTLKAMGQAETDNWPDNKNTSYAVGRGT